jgi:hypothetical protein
VDRDEREAAEGEQQADAGDDPAADRPGEPAGVPARAARGRALGINGGGRLGLLLGSFGVCSLSWR